MAYFLAGAFHNEFSSNVEALGDYSFSSLASYYGYHINRLQAIGAILLIGIVYHLLLLVLLKVTDLASRKVVMRNVRDARRRAKLVLAAGIRWTGSISSAGSSAVSLASDNDNQSELEIKRNAKGRSLASQLMDTQSMSSGGDSSELQTSSSGISAETRSTGSAGLAVTVDNDGLQQSMRASFGVLTEYSPPIFGSLSRSPSGLMVAATLSSQSERYSFGPNNGVTSRLGNRTRTNTESESINGDSRVGIASSVGHNNASDRRSTTNDSLFDVSQLPGVYVGNTSSNSVSSNVRYTAVESAIPSGSSNSSSEDSFSIRDSVSITHDNRTSYGGSGGQQSGVVGRQFHPNMNQSQSMLSGSPAQMSPFLARANQGGLGSGGLNKRSPWQQTASSVPAVGVGSSSASPLLASSSGQVYSDIGRTSEMNKIAIQVQSDILTSEHERDSSQQQQRQQFYGSETDK